MPHSSTSSFVIDAARKTAIPYLKTFAKSGIVAALYKYQQLKLGTTRRQIAW